MTLQVVAATAPTPATLEHARSPSDRHPDSASRACRVLALKFVRGASLFVPGLPYPSEPRPFPFNRGSHSSEAAASEHVG